MALGRGGRSRRRSTLAARVRRVSVHRRPPAAFHRLRVVGFVGCAAARAGRLITGLLSWRVSGPCGARTRHPLRRALPRARALRLGPAGGPALLAAAPARGRRAQPPARAPRAPQDLLALASARCTALLIFALNMHSIWSISHFVLRSLLYV